MKRALILLAAASSAFLGGYAAYPDAPLPIHHEDEPGWNCHTEGNKICGPTNDSAELARRAELARDMLRSENTDYNCYIEGCGAGSYALDDLRRITAELNEDSPYVHDDLIEGCEGDWTDPFCDIVRHYQDIRITLISSATPRLRQGS